MIELIDIHKWLGGQEVLRGVDLHIETGETLVIIGRSGCGKTVLLKHLIGLMRPDQGRILLNGFDYARLSTPELYAMRRRFGMVFQGSALFDTMTVAENVGLGLREHTSMSRDEIAEVVSERLRMVGLSGLDHQRPAELSGGMKKRVALARALAMDPEYVLYDEPTTGLDPITADMINELIKCLQAQLTITSVAVTHDMKSAYKIADRIAMLYQGRIIFSGSPVEVRETGNPVVQQFIQGIAEGPIECR
ncbi:hypothetical protein AMJ39_01805 [candidate division TA06 bacterium DG_24]|uniref:ABC transporter domain-containing protein n=3 Tax=Bacteria division TA06 TaxID=1156500 RepID=A0A0S8JKE6_UNCT6|nr:MAG: hypothetical protein AMJ39_01805 [candidate division TA06 bacterium DG_24]KPK71602.1 MAG: hypothetical protein AMJ82_00535 [candidate division TA06 bacterium SM23_40]KPL10215.1 MAG: hypothetical protein AMJ71_03930 [candidate division TA06 bacterium SM1_40]